MTHVEFLQNNFLIARYMGYNYPDFKNAVFENSFWDLHNYSKNWESLMPVCQRIRKYYFNPDNEVNKEASRLYANIQGALLMMDIERLWANCIEFIKWYNQQESITYYDTRTKYR